MQLVMVSDASAWLFPSAELLLPSVAAERALHRETSRAQNLVALPQLTRLRRAVFFLKFVHHIHYLQC